MLVYIASAIIVILGLCVWIAKAQKSSIIVSKQQGNQDRNTNKIDAFVSLRSPLRYKIPTEDLSFDPSSHDVIYYNPTSHSVYEDLIEQNLETIKKIFHAQGMHFIYLPDINGQLSSIVLKEQIEYSDPRIGKQRFDYKDISYSDIAESYYIPDSVIEPCLVRCMSADYDRGFKMWGGKTDLTGISFDESALYFSIKFLESIDIESFLCEIRTYLSNCYTGPLYHIDTKEETETKLAGLSADERFDEDMYLIGREIRERIDRLRAKGLSSLAIRKLIGDDADKPGKLLIDKHNKLILTDFGNKEIKLEPLHKAVFFLFLRHPEGIYFKDLGNYREELGAIYREITGREDLAGIQDSINKLTDPLNNSINEKCARIKNAFVSEFREEVAQWYFIDGNRGEKKTIKLPRELVTWEIKD